MSKNIKQVYDSNPIISNNSTDLIYFGRSPYGVGNDTAMLFSDFANQFVRGNGAATSVLGRSANSSGPLADIQAADNNQILRRSADVLGFGSIDLSQSNAVGTSVLPVANGGTNIASYTVGDLIYASGMTTLSTLPDVATGNALISGGIGVQPSWGKIDLTTAITGTLTQANGGTNATSYGATQFILQNSGNTAFNSSASFTGTASTFTISSAINTDNAQLTIDHTVNASPSTAKNLIRVAGSSAGDAFTQYVVNGITNWAVGIDNSDSDAYVISNNTDPGTNNRLKITTAGVVSIPNLSVSLPVFTDSSSNLVSTGVVPVASGGTNISSYTAGDLIYASASTVLSKLADVATGNALLSGGVGVAPLWGKVSLTTAISGILPIANGGTSSSSQTISGICYTDSAPAILSGSNFTYNGSNIVTLTSGSSSCVLSLVNTLTGATNTAIINLQRADQPGGSAQLRLFTGSTNIWRTGLFIGNNDYHFNDDVSGLDRLVITQAGLINIPGLTASLPVFTDSSKNLVSVTTVPQANGGTGVDASGYAASQIIFQNAGNTGFTSSAAYTFGANASMLITSASSGVNVVMQLNQTASGGAGTARYIAQVTNGSSGDPYTRYTITSTTDWATGIDNSDQDAYVICTSTTPGTTNRIRIDASTGDTDIVTGNLIIDTVGKTLKVKQGTNACSGTGAVMVGGAVTVNTTAVATGDTILIMKTAAGGTSTTGMPAITIVNGTSFTITGGALDTSTWNWLIIKPSP